MREAVDAAAAMGVAAEADMAEAVVVAVDTEVVTGMVAAAATEEDVVAVMEAAVEVADMEVVVADMVVVVAAMTTRYLVPTGLVSDGAQAYNRTYDIIILLYTIIVKCQKHDLTINILDGQLLGWLSFCEKV